MEQKRFAELMREPVCFTAADYDELHRLAEAYPYSAVVGLLERLAARSAGADVADGRRRVELMLPRPGRLAELESHVRTARPAEEPFDVLRAINSYKEVSFKTAPKSVILSNFLSSDDFNVPQQAPAEELSIAELGKKSITADDSLESETLAVILAKQGRYDKAVDVYRKLILKYPEKNSTFAARIEELELLITNNK